MSSKLEFIIASLESKGYRIESRQSTNSKTSLHTIYHRDYCNGLQPIASGLVITQLKTIDICDSVGFARASDISTSPVNYNKSR